MSDYQYESNRSKKRVPLIIALILIISIVLSYIYFQKTRESDSDNRGVDNNQYPWKKYPLITGDFIFPDDEGRHSTEIEWWYANGHLTNENDITYGYMICFFNTGLFVASITDEMNNKYYNYSELYSNYHISYGKMDLQFGNNRFYQIQDKPFDYKLTVETSNFHISLNLRAEKPPLTEGIIPIEDGFSYYYSQTDLNTTGYLTVNSNNLTVKGKSWIDRQWGEWDEPAGWEWFSIQLENGMEIMADKIFDRETGYPKSQILYIMNPDDKMESYNWTNEMYNFRVEYGDYWASIDSGFMYSHGWDLYIPSKNMHLNIEPDLDEQEMNPLNKIPNLDRYLEHGHFWEGKCRVTGEFQGETVLGNAYVECTYDYGSIKGDVTVLNAEITHLYENEYSIRIEIENNLVDPNEEIFIKVFADDPDYGGSTIETYVKYAITNLTIIEEIIDLDETNIVLFIIADPDNNIAETDEHNNVEEIEI